MSYPEYVIKPPRTPRCVKCGYSSRNHIVTPVGWMCSGCVYKREHPDALIESIRVVKFKMPQELDPLDLQEETLF